MGVCGLCKLTLTTVPPCHCHVLANGDGHFHGVVQWSPSLVERTNGVCPSWRGPFPRSAPSKLHYSLLSHANPLRVFTDRLPYTRATLSGDRTNLILCFVCATHNCSEAIDTLETWGMVSRGLISETYYHTWSCVAGAVEVYGGSLPLGRCLRLTVSLFGFSLNTHITLHIQ